MKCAECEAEMVETKRNHHYTPSGLRILLLDVPVFECEACGEYEVVIPKIEQLHQTITEKIVTSSKRLAPSEIRFLRKQLGHSTEDFAKIFPVTRETVSRWENGKAVMNEIAERYLRLLALHGPAQVDYGSASGADDEPQTHRLRFDQNQWQGHEVAC